MKKVLILVFVFTLIGCKSYIQVYETNSKNNIDIVDSKYVYENDTLKITYNLWHNKGLIDFTIYNKLDIPIYIDWKKSSYIDNSVKLNYWKDEENTRSATIQDYYYYKGYYNKSLDYIPIGRSLSLSNSTKTKEERITFIPPKSIYRRAQFHILPFDTNILSDKNQYIEVPLNGNSKKKTRIYERSYNDVNTTLTFRNFLTSSLTEDFESEFYVDNEFYISKVLKMDKKHFSGNAHNDDKFKNYRHFYIDLGKVSTPKKLIKVEINKKK